MRSKFSVVPTNIPNISPTPLANLNGNQKTALPRRSSAFQLYTRMHYPSRVKPTFTPFFAALQKVYIDSIKSQADNDVKPPVEIAERTKMAYQFWVQETDEFRKQIQENADDEYNHAMAAWEEDKKIPISPQQYHQYVNPYVV